MGQSNYLVHDGSFFIGLTSVPFGAQKKQIDKLDKLFAWAGKNLLDKVMLNGQNESEKESHESLENDFYKPKYFFLFGDFDLAAISLVEGFNFPLRQFNYYNVQQTAECEELRFSRHSILGPTPRFTEESIDKLAKTVLTKQEKEFPLVSISRLKINDLYLFNFGVEFIRAVIATIREIIFEINEYDEDFTFLIVENYGWSEITILFFSNNFQFLNDLISQKISGLTFNDLLTKLEPIDKDLHELLKNKSSLRLSDFDNLPIFLDSFSVLGFDFNLIRDEASTLIDKISGNDRIFPVLECSVKPGYQSIFIKEYDKMKLKFFRDNFQLFSTAGKTDIILRCKTETGVSTKEFIKAFRELTNKTAIVKYFTKMTTLVSFEIKSNSPLAFQVSPHELLLDKTKPLAFLPSDLKKIKNQLSRLNMPHVAKEAILNFYGIYNRNIINPASYSNFVELKSFLDYLKLIIEDAYNENGKKNILNTLDLSLNAFNHAYHNRILDSYVNKDKYDYFTFLTIGAQELVSSFDIAYKNIAHVLGNPNGFVFVEADHEFTTSDIALRLNYFHLFNPELLCSVIVQEVANQAKSKFEDTNPKLFLFHAESATTATPNLLIRSYLAKNGLNDEGRLREYKFYVELCTPELMEHFFTDMIGYEIFYENDSSLFQHWSWGYFSTDARHYIEGIDTGGNFNGDESLFKQEKLVAFLIRQLVVFKIMDYEVYKNYEFNFDLSLNNEIKEHIYKAKQFIDNYLCKGQLENWFLLVKRFAETLKQNVMNEIRYSDDVSMITDRLIKGEVIKYDSKYNKLEAFWYTRNLFYAYLKGFMRLKKEKYNKTYYLIRRNEFGNIPNPEYCNVLFDRQGGTYIIDSSLRRKVYKLRSAFHMSLFDMGYKEKGKMFAKYLN